MPSTTFHFPDRILDRIDAAARRHGVSRNKFVMTACERALEEDDGDWPPGFFEPGFSAEDWDLLSGGTHNLEHAIADSRRNRGASLL